MFSKLYSFGLSGMSAFTVEVETDTAKGMPSFEIVGLPDAAIKESRDRVRSAFKNCGYEFPACRITINLAPADRKKTGPIYDLPIFMSLLHASGQIKGNFDKCAFIGELSLQGEVRAVTGVLPMVIQARDDGFEHIFVPAKNAKEGAIVSGISVYGIERVTQLVDFLSGATQLTAETAIEPTKASDVTQPDFCDVKGQENARRALEIAASGGHNALLIGSPGAGKSMLAKRLPSILSEMTFEESLETTKIHSIAGLLGADSSLITTRPFRAPHHTVSVAGLAGGGVGAVSPGEISLAHNGVLFLDELPEFRRDALEVLRQPMEDNKVTISRVGATLTYPCSFMLIAAMNPCKCGYMGHPTRKCTCTETQVTKYLQKVSGPLLDRLDLHIDAMPVDFNDLASDQKSESSAEIKKRVDKARAIQVERYRGTDIKDNAHITPSMLNEICVMTDDAKALLQNTFDRMGLSARAYDRILKVARTIADMDNSEKIATPHIAQAVQYRSLDRKYWSR